MYHWQSEHQCGTCTMVLRAVPDVLSSTHHDQWLNRGGPTLWPPRSPDLNPLDLYPWGHFRALVHGAPVDNEQALHHSNMDACQTIHNYHRHLWTDVGVHETCPGLHWVSRRTLNTSSVLIHELNVSEHMFIRTIVLVFVCVTFAQRLSAPSSYSLYINITLKWFSTTKNVLQKLSPNILLPLVL
jgi:hypothetical protein